MSDANSSLTIRVGTAGVATAISEIKALGSVIGSLAAPISALASVAGFSALAKQGLDFSTQLLRMKSVMGGSIQDMAGLAYAGERVEVSLDSIRAGLKSFSEYLIKTGQGSRNMKEALLEEAAIFQQMPDGVQKTARAVELFGRSGALLIPLLNQGPQALEAMFERGGELSGVTDQMAQSAEEFQHALKDLKTASEGLAASLVSGLLPSLTHIIENATDGIVKFRQWTQQSQYFKVAVEALVIALGLLAGGWAVNLIAGRLLITCLGDISLLLPVITRMVAASVVEFGIWGIAIASVTAVVVAGIEAWKLYKAKKEEALSEKNAKDSMDNLASAINRNIDSQVNIGTLTGAQGDEMKRTISSLTDEWKKGTLSLDDYRKKLDEIAVKLRETNPKQETPSAGFIFTPEMQAAYHKNADSLRALELAKRQAEADVTKAANEVEEKRLEESYRKKLITIQDYYAQKQKLEESNTEADKAPKLYQLDTTDALIKDLQSKRNETDKNDLTQIATLDAQINQLKAQRVKIVSEIIALDEKQKANSIEEAGKSQQEIQQQQLQKMEESQKQRLLQLDKQLSDVEGNYLLTSVQKYEQKKKILQEQAAALQIYTASLKALAATQDPAAKQQTLARADTAEKQLDQTNRSIASLGPDPKSFKEQWQTTIRGLQDQMGTWAENSAKLFGDVFNSAISSISQGITGLIMGTETWSQALMNIGTSILETVIQSIVQMGVRWVMTQLMMASMGRSILAASVAATTPIAVAQSAIWATPATLSTIATYGVSALLAPGMIAAANSMTMAESLMGFAQGGYTGDGGKYEVAGLVHRGEFVMPSESVNRIGVPKLEALKSGASIGATNVEGHKVNLHFYDERPHPRDFLASGEGENMVVNIAKKNRLKIGVGT